MSFETENRKAIRNAERYALLTGLVLLLVIVLTPFWALPHLESDLTTRSLRALQDASVDTRGLTLSFSGRSATIVGTQEDSQRLHLARRLVQEVTGVAGVSTRAIALQASGKPTPPTIVAPGPAAPVPAGLPGRSAASAAEPAASVASGALTGAAREPETALPAVDVSKSQPLTNTTGQTAAQPETTTKPGTEAAPESDQATLVAPLQESNDQEQPAMAPTPAKLKQEPAPPLSDEPPAPPPGPAPAVDKAARTEAELAAAAEPASKPEGKGERRTPPDPTGPALTLDANEVAAAEVPAAKIPMIELKAAAPSAQDQQALGAPLGSTRGASSLAPSLEVPGPGLRPPLQQPPAARAAGRDLANLTAEDLLADWPRLGRVSKLELEIGPDRIHVSGQVDSLQERARIAHQTPGFIPADALEMNLSLVPRDAAQLAEFLNGLVIERLRFSGRGARFAVGGELAMDRIAEVLNSYPHIRLGLLGFADPQTHPFARRTVSRHRAAAAYHALIARGVDSRRLLLPDFPEPGSPIGPWYRPAQTHPHGQIQLFSLQGNHLWPTPPPK